MTSKSKYLLKAAFSSRAAKMMWSSPSRSSTTTIKRKIGYAELEDEITKTRTKLARMEIDRSTTNAEASSSPEEEEEEEEDSE